MDEAVDEVAVNDEYNLMDTNDNENLKRLLQSQNTAFKPFFVGRVMNRIEQLEATQGAPTLAAAFARVALPGLAVAVALLLGVYLSQGSLNLDSLTGLSDLYVEDVMLYETFANNEWP